MRPATGKNEPIAFSKMAGGGNDFIVIDNRQGRIGEVEDLTRRICTRRLSVGADGLILVETSPRATFRMRYYNADGSLGSFCGNGTRCAARFAFLNVIAPRKMTIETDAGIVGAEIGERGEVTIALPAPRDFVASRPLEVRGESLPGSYIRVGVPHYVLYVEGDLWALDIDGVGRAVRHHPDLRPEGANVNFVAVRDVHSIEVRTWERGVEAETLACGSGVVASVAVSTLFRRVSSPVSVLTRSGITLEVSFDHSGGTFENLRLKGDARLVYKSTLTPETVEGFDPEFVRNPTSRAGVT